MSAGMLLEWWNLIYLVPFGLALVYLALFVFTGVTFGDADADADLDADAGADVHADTTVHVEATVVGDAGMDHDADLDHDASGDHGAALAHAEPDIHAHPHGHASTDAAAHGGRSFAADVLAFLGVGKIPLSLAVMVLLLVWGVTGFCVNALLLRWVAAWMVGPISLPVTAVISVAVTGAVAAALGKAIPLADSRGNRREDLVGKTGDAIYDIDATFGMASVRTPSGDLFQVPCQTADGRRIPKGSRVVLFAYDRDKGVFHVAPFAT
jgi:hypothetical protein